MEKYNSIYLGIVVQNNDPEHRGRVKVWVPHISSSIYNKWNQVKKDVTFAFPGSDDGKVSEFSAILSDLKDTLPWAEFASPVMGGSTAGYYNAPADLRTVSDAPILYGLPGTNYSNTSSSTNTDPENKGNKPGAYFESHPVSDAFGNTAKITSQNYNTYSNQYKPATYSNAAKGIFSIPNVGAHVWVFFRDGVPQYPVYFAAAFGQEDFKSIFSAADTWVDYPNTFENKDQRIPANVEDKNTYRNKMVINQRAAAIEIINTTGRESYKVTHFGGGFYELNNNFTAQFNPKNFQLLTLADKFETVNGHNNIFVKRVNDYIVQGDSYLKVGNFNVEAAAKWDSLYKQLAKETDAAQIQKSLNALISPLADQEAESGFGGNHFEFISKHKIISVGLVKNTTPAYTTVPASISLITGISPSETGFYFAPFYVDTTGYKYLTVPDKPDGNLEIFAMNKAKIETGTGGLALKTTGIATIGAGIVNVIGDGINIGSKEGLIDINGSAVTITADFVNLKNRSGNQVVVDSTLGVSKNVIIGGGAYVEGELYVNHISAPVEYQVTENTQIRAEGPPVNIAGIPGQVASGWAIEGGLATGTLNVTVATGNLATTGSTAQLTVNLGSLINIIGGLLQISQPHSHVFKNVPLNLYNGAVSGPSQFFNTAADEIGTSNKTAIGADGRLDSRKQVIGFPPPKEFFVGTDGLPVNTWNGPGSLVAGPRVKPEL